MSDFIQNKNKELLWNLLLNNGVFNNLTEDKLPFVRKDFEILINTLSQQNANQSLIEKNKIFVLEMIKKINNYDKVELRTYEPVKEMYTSQDIRNKKLDEFNNQVKKAEDDFNSIIKLKTPEEINFFDKNTQETPISNMDELIEKTIAERNLDVENIVTTNNEPKNVNEWLNIKSEETTEKSEQKKVKIMEENNQIFEFSNNNNQLMNLLVEIKNNQLEMLKLLKQQ
mgnify:CR=1 FL=1